MRINSDHAYIPYVHFTLPIRTEDTTGPLDSVRSVTQRQTRQRSWLNATTVAGCDVRDRVPYSIQAGSQGRTRVFCCAPSSRNEDTPRISSCTPSFLLYGSVYCMVRSSDRHRNEKALPLRTQRYPGALMACGHMYPRLGQPRSHVWIRGELLRNLAQELLLATD